MVATLARFYGDLASIPASTVGKARDEIGSISPDELSDRDRALRSAALALAGAVVSPPSPQSIAQAEKAEKNAPAPATHSLIAPNGPAVKAHGDGRNRTGAQPSPKSNLPISWKPDATS